ncbi:MAG: ABC transporter permease [Actinomycetota bacterium]|jgi:ABC-2 type transport system permease protein|nr:ABC transporter permease [Actinomycetota bacterium]
MMRILAMLRLSVLQTLRDRGELFSMLVLPIALTWVFGMAFGSVGYESDTVVLWLEGGDNSVYAEQLRDIVDEQVTIEVRDASADGAQETMEADEASMIVEIPEGFGDSLMVGEQATIEVTTNPDSDRSTSALEALQGAITRVSTNAQAASWVAEYGDVQPVEDGDVIWYPERRFSLTFDQAYEIADSFWDPDPPVGVDSVIVSESEVRGDTVMAASNVQYSVGFMIMFVMFMAFGTAGGILEEREQGTLRRLLVVPASRPIILSGKVAGVIGGSALEATILVGLGAVAFGVPWGKEPLALLLVLGAYILAASGLAVFVTATVRTRGQLSAAGPVLTTALAMLGGCYWPIEITPGYMQTIAKFTPTGWAMSGLLDVVARNQGLEAAWLPAGILILFAAVTFAAGLTVLKFE